MLGGIMDISIYNLVSGNLTQSVDAINQFYASLSMDVRSQSDQVLFATADEWTGNRQSRSHTEALLEENRRYLGNAYQGLAIVQTAQRQSSRIHNALEEMESLAEMAASGQYSAEEVESFQQEFETWMGEIDQIAIGTHPGGFMMLSFTATGAVGSKVDQDQKVQIDSMDMTVTGLGILDSMDLVTQPDQALTAVQAAMDKVSVYGQHLENTKDTLEETLDTLNNERQALLPILATVSEKQSAWQALEAIVSVPHDTTASLLALQAQVESDRAIQLLLNELE